MGSQWILSMLNRAVAGTVEALEKWELSGATTVVYDFWQYKLCGVFIEIIKPIMQGSDAAAKRRTRDTLWVCLEAGLRLLHPFMPFVTEELWQRLPKRAGAAAAQSIMVSEYPRVVPGWDRPQAEAYMALVDGAVHTVRSLREKFKLEPKAKPALVFVCKTEDAQKTLQLGAQDVRTLASASDVQVLGASGTPPAGAAVDIVDENIQAYLVLEGLVDAAKEIAKLAKRSEEINKQLETLAKKMAAPGYQEKVPANVRELDASKGDKLREELDTIAIARQNFEKLLTAES
eukprot:TRINITY_DN5463_c0_g6_i1.p1 TRINITY_DN5463_c0_g6~~TRINITY_DN5463_c0_g6_i1.p1  ORF type:complete len:340 (+),score=108.86 TRINITY_DN5463_c0_g6_i1:155-1021(+)